MTYDLYVQRFSGPDGKVSATFEILTLTGWAPHESQQKPLKPGSAKMRLADALGEQLRDALMATPAFAQEQAAVETIAVGPSAEEQQPAAKPTTGQAARRLTRTARRPEPWSTASWLTPSDPMRRSCFRVWGCSRS